VLSVPSTISALTSNCSFGRILADPYISFSNGLGALLSVIQVLAPDVKRFALLNVFEFPTLQVAVIAKVTYRACLRSSDLAMRVHSI
jgi:hypothetical protein